MGNNAAKMAFNLKVQDMLDLIARGMRRESVCGDRRRMDEKGNLSFAGDRHCREIWRIFYENGNKTYGHYGRSQSIDIYVPQLIVCSICRCSERQQANKGKGEEREKEDLYLKRVENSRVSILKCD